MTIGPVSVLAAQYLNCDIKGQFVVLQRFFVIALLLMHRAKIHLGHRHAHVLGAQLLFARWGLGQAAVCP